MSRGDWEPPDRDRVIVWRVGDALLAAPLARTAEIAAVDPDGRAMSRSGPLELQAPPGLPLPRRPHRAVVLRAGETAVAMAADEVEGVRSYTDRQATATPAWLDSLRTDHLAALILLDDQRIAALLAIDTLIHP